MDLVHNRFRLGFFLVLAILFVVIVVTWNHVAGLFFQIRGGLMLNDLLYSNTSQQPASIACLGRESISLDQKYKLSSAANSLKRASSHNHKSAQTYLLLGRAYCMLGEYESAVDAYQKYTSIRPVNPLGHLELGFAYEALGTQVPINQNNLIEKLDNIQPEQVKDFREWYRNDAAAIEWLAAGLTADDFLNTGKLSSEDEKFNEALTWYQRALWLQIDSAPTWIAVANILEETGNPQKALNAYWAAYFFNPEAGATDLVRALDSQGDAPTTESILTEVLRDYPESDQRFQWWDILSSTVAEQERWSDVERISRQAIDENPTWLEFRVDLGWALYNQNADWKAAIKEFEQAIVINESRPEGYFAMAGLLTLEKRFSEADPYYVRAIERKPDDKWYQLNWATNARSAGNINLALQIFENILVKYPEYSRAYYEAAMAYFLDEQYTKAKDTIEQAISLLETPDQWYFARAGAIFEGAGEFDWALDYYQRALEVNPANSTAIQGAARLGGE